MRLPIIFLLVTLALCCYEANALVCPAVSDEMSNFLLGPEALFKLKLAKFNAPTEAIAAKLTVKKCTDQIALDNRLRITKILGKVLAECGI